MVYVASLAGIGLVLLDETLRASETLLAGRLTVQVPAEASAARVETIVAVLHQTPNIRSVHLLTPSETSRLLEPWLGSSVPLDELPVPQLIDAGIEPVGAVDMAKLQHQLASVVPETRLDEYGPVVRGLRARARPVQALLGAAIAGALLLVAALTAFVIAATVVARHRTSTCCTCLAPTTARSHGRTRRARWVTGLSAAASPRRRSSRPLRRLAAPVS